MGIYQENLQFLLDLDDDSFRKFCDAELVDCLNVDEENITVFKRILMLEIRIPMRKLVQVLALTKKRFNLDFYLKKSKGKFSEILDLHLHSLKVDFDFYSEIAHLNDYKNEFHILLKRKYKNKNDFDANDLFFIIYFNLTIRLTQESLDVLNSLLIQVVELRNILERFGKLYLLLLVQKYQNTETILGLLLENAPEIECVPFDLDFEMDSLYILNKGPILQDSPVKNPTNMASILTANDLYNKNLYSFAKIKETSVDEDEQQELNEQKLKILALVEDDEYDDTYDDAINPENLAPELGEILSNDEIYLIENYLNNVTVFHRSSRKTKERLEALSKTGMSDEQFEGWYIMFNRNVIHTLI
jgi:hypothetical protein